ncbi:MAG: hypothetical protein MJE63_04600 [Proteobacteria bacterium]|nr:hypothetical protein [Pseudomonadota bacterium]
MISKLRQIKDRTIARVLTRHPALFRAWERKSQGPVFDDSPWHPLNKPIEDCNVSLVTTGGVHLRTQESFNMNDPDGDHSYREIYTDTEMRHLKITHNYYEHKDADADINVVFPIEPLRNLAETGEIGEVNKRHFSFMGHLQNSQMEKLVQKSAPEVAAYLKEDGVDVVVLSPA